MTDANNPSIDKKSFLAPHPYDDRVVKYNYVGTMEGIEEIPAAKLYITSDNYTISEETILRLCFEKNFKI